MITRLIPGLVLASLASAADVVHTHHPAAESFNANWRFARYGLQAEGHSIPEPGKPVARFKLSASSTESRGGSTLLPEYAMDDTGITRWCAKDGSFPQSLSADFGENLSLSGVEIVFERAPENYFYTLTGTDDKGKSETLIQRRAGEAPRNSIRFNAPRTLRNLKIDFSGSTNGSYASVCEIRLFDEKGAIIPNTRLAGNEKAPFDPAFNDSNWRSLSIPHDWGVEGPFRIDLNGNTGKLPWAGIGWYRKEVTIPAASKGKQIYLDFDGAMAYAKIYCNGSYVGTWPYGYSSFRMDLTPFIKFGEKNVVAVRLDTEQWDSRWYPGAGIYRNTWLVTVDPVHVAHWGTYITTPAISEKQADLALELTVENKAETAQTITVKTDVFELNRENAIGRKVAAFPSETLTIPAGKQQTGTFRGSLEKPTLWSLENPARYVARTRLYRGGSCIDTYDTPFGVRSLTFTREGFYLNGKRIDVKGVCQHHDLGALGGAFNRRAQERQLEILQSMGCNAIRTSHNPPDPNLLDLADRMGILIQVESFDAWAHGKLSKDYNRIYNEWHEKDLSAIVRRDRNHPAVFMWTIGNEVIEQPNVEMTRELVQIIKRLDSTRSISNGYNNPNGARNSGAAMELDCIGINYFFGAQPKYDADPRYANKPTMGTETSSAISTRGEYFFEGKKREGHQITSYDTDAVPWGCQPDVQFRTNAKFPYLWGEFVWTGFDYLGEPTPFNSDATNLLNFRNDPSKRAELEAELKRLEKERSPARSSYFGIIDLAGFPKDRFYNYQAHWLPEKPMAHILPHWNWPERIGKNVPVTVYASGDTAELFVNGKSQGIRTKRPKQDFRFTWNDVVYEPGTVKVVVTKDGKPWAEKTIATTGAASKLVLEADRSRLNAADATDLSFITVRVADKKGVTVPRTHNMIRFRIEGEGEIVAVDNGNPISFEPFQADYRKAFNGLALVIVKAKPGSRGFTLHAESDGLSKASVKITNR